MDKENDFEQFFRSHYQSYYFFALRFLEEEEASRDVVNDAMEYVYRNYHDSRVDSWEGYALSFIRSRCIDLIRRRSVQRRYAEFYQAHAERLQASAAEETDERMEMLMAAIEELPEKTRQVLRECYLNKKKYREVALEMGISEESVHKHIVRALKKLREKFAKNIEPR
jgi:RNA polymerase sigma factor (sigma-70 family)